MEEGAAVCDPRAVQRCTFSLVVSLVIVLTGMLFTYRLGLQYNDLDHRLSHLMEDLQEDREYLSAIQR